MCLVSALVSQPFRNISPWAPASVPSGWPLVPSGHLAFVVVRWVRANRLVVFRVDNNTHAELGRACSQPYMFLPLEFCPSCPRSCSSVPPFESVWLLVLRLSQRRRVVVALVRWFGLFAPVWLCVANATWAPWLQPQGVQPANA